MNTYQQERENQELEDAAGCVLVILSAIGVLAAILIEVSKHF